MKIRKITDSFTISFDDGSDVRIESKYKASVFDDEDETTEAYKFVNNLNVSYTVKTNPIIDSLLQALGDKALSKCSPEVEEDSEGK